MKEKIQSIFNVDKLKSDLDSADSLFDVQEYERAFKFVEAYRKKMADKGLDYFLENNLWESEEHLIYLSYLQTLKEADEQEKIAQSLIQRPVDYPSYSDLSKVEMQVKNTETNLFNTLNQEKKTDLNSLIPRRGKYMGNVAHNKAVGWEENMTKLQEIVLRTLAEKVGIDYTNPQDTERALYNSKHKIDGGKLYWQFEDLWLKKGLRDWNGDLYWKDYFYIAIPSTFNERAFVLKVDKDGFRFNYWTTFYDYQRFAFSQELL